MMRQNLWCLVVLIMAPVALAEPDREVSGRMVESTSWDGTIVVKQTVTVVPGAVLTIGPGTRVVFHKGSCLVVEGRLLAEGGEKTRIHFELAKGVLPGEWSGLVIRPESLQVGPSKLTGCQVSGAAVGITLESDGAAHHQVVDCRFENCSDVGILVAGASRALVKDNQVIGCGSAAGKICGGIVLDESRYALVQGNTITDCRRFGIVVNDGDLNRIKSNKIQSIAGKPRSTEGMGICIQAGSNRNLVLSNHVTGCNYNCIVIYSRENQVIDNDVGNSPDGMGLAGRNCRGNIVRDNRISRGWWSTLYVTSMARDNVLYNNVVYGGDGGITTRAAGPNLWENCHFYNHNSQGHVVLMGTGIATFRRCTLKTNGPHHLSLEYGSHARVIDCNFDKQRVVFGKGTGESNFVEWLHTVEVSVVDAESDRPVPGAMVRIESERDSNRQMSAETKQGGRAAFEVLETVIRKNGTHDVTPHRVVVAAKGYESGNLSEVEVRERMQLTVRLRPSVGGPATNRSP